MMQTAWEHMPAKPSFLVSRIATCNMISIVGQRQTYLAHLVLVRRSSGRFSISATTQTALVVPSTAEHKVPSPLEVQTCSDYCGENMSAVCYIGPQERETNHTDPVIDPN